MAQTRLTKALQRRHTLDGPEDVVPSPMTHLPKLLTGALLVVAALALGVARPAAAATPCWKALLNDWYDGRIDHTYAKHCYTDALNHLPTDVRTYSSAHDDIERALQSALAAERTRGKRVGPNTPLPPQPGAKPGGHAAGGTTTTQAVPGRKPPPGIAGELTSGSPSSLPLPLLVLGGLALVLVGAGAVGLVVRRLQGRGPRSP